MRGKLPLVIAHLKAINSWNDADVHVALENTDERFQWRRRFNWDLDLSLLAGKIDLDHQAGLLIPTAKRHHLGNSYRTD
jgi:hypothetical protein